MIGKMLSNVKIGSRRAELHSLGLFLHPFSLCNSVYSHGRYLKHKVVPEAEHTDPQNSTLARLCLMHRIVHES